MYSRKEDEVTSSLSSLGLRRHRTRSHQAAVSSEERRAAPSVTAALTANMRQAAQGGEDENADL